MGGLRRAVQALEVDGNAAVLRGWVARWEPLADAAIQVYFTGLGDPDGAAAAMEATREFRRGEGV